MFTIKSVSDEGTYFLNKNWKKSKSFWKFGSEITRADMYKTAASAKASLSKLLKVMDEYLTDRFFLVETDADDRIISEQPFTAKRQAWYKGNMA